MLWRMIFRPLWLVLLATPLSACGTLGSLFAERFTFEGELPADFALRAQAHYYVTESNCPGLVSRSQLTKSFETEFKPEPHGYRFAIPASYRIGICQARLGRVALYIKGKHGEKEWQQTYDNGELRVVEELPEGFTSFLPDGTLHRQAICSWLFQKSHAISRVGEIEKILQCKGAGAYLLGQELAGKTVRLDIALNPEEEPSRDDTWIKFLEGWKPCLPKPGWQRCQNPPLFQTFKINGQECTVYPNCTE
ncbi:MAG TPA: hypothetical protein VL178_11865 [Pseudomonas sp.]|nr:hypothetical protein [Pseudomonas sp.]